MYTSSKSASAISKGHHHLQGGHTHGGATPTHLRAHTKKHSWEEQRRARKGVPLHLAGKTRVPHSVRGMTCFHVKQTRVLSLDYGTITRYL